VAQLAIADALLVELGIQHRRQALAHLRRAEEYLLQRRMSGSRESTKPPRILHRHPSAG